MEVACMYLTPKRIAAQLKKADKLMRVIWRLYSPYREHRKKIVKASFYLIQVVELLEALLDEVKKDYANELKKPLTKKSIPPGYHRKEENSDEKKSVDQ
jgi:hypothetical protein